MAARYQVRLKDQAGVQVALFTDWRTLIYRKEVNGINSYSFEMDGDDSRTALFALDGQFEVLRRDIAASPAIDWYVDFEGFHRSQIFSTERDGLSRFASIGVGYNHLLARRAILYRLGTSGAEKSGAGENVIKSYVNENAGQGAIAPPRIFGGVTNGLTMQASGGAGASWTGARPYRPLIEVVQEIAAATGVDFEVLGMGPATFEFRAKASPLGADRTTIGLNPSTGLNGAGNAPVIFSLDHGNMEIPTFEIGRLQEVTSAIILGQGIEADRAVIQGASADVSDSPWNRLEVVRNGNLEDSTDGLFAVANAVLDSMQASETLSFQVLQVPGTLYGRDYFVGDNVTARYKTFERHVQIVAATITVLAEGAFGALAAALPGGRSGERETINIEVSNVI